jgi:hypothetical protein
MIQSLKERWSSYRGDGCSAVPDLWLKEACRRHDRHYTFGTHMDGTPITRWEADLEFLKDARRDAPGFTPIGRFITRNTIPFIYWLGVRLGGAPHWGDS